jgi:hypothetical protein
LPINLRRFLAAELGQRLCIDETTIAPASGEFPEAFMRDLARAIRRFSFTRAHESWVETLIGRVELEDALISACGGGCHLALCLCCARLSIGPDALSEHRKPSCLAVSLSHSGKRDLGEEQMSVTSQLRCALYREIETFRGERAAQRLPHFDLDYYLRDSQYVFTWRPVPSV